VYAVDVARINVAPNNSRITRVRPFNLKIPLATIIRSVELHVNAVSGRKNAVWRKFIVGPIIISGIIESKKFDAVASAIHDSHVALVVRQSRTTLKRAQFTLESDSLVLFDCAFDPILQFAVAFRQLFQHFVGTTGREYRRSFLGPKLHELSDVEFVDRLMVW
jgi:hypothetical protein